MDTSRPSLRTNWTRLRRRLGEGNYGSVFRARTTPRAPEGRGQQVVVKRVAVDLDQNINDMSEALQARALRAARAPIKPEAGAGGRGVSD